MSCLCTVIAGPPIPFNLTVLRNQMAFNVHILDSRRNLPTASWPPNTANLVAYPTIGPLPLSDAVVGPMQVRYVEIFIIIVSAICLLRLLTSADIPPTRADPSATTVVLASQSPALLPRRLVSARTSPGRID